jgi:hypothetical protein
VPPLQYRNNNSRFEFGASSNKQSGGNATDCFDDWNNFDNQGFRGDFGAFDEGYFKVGQHFNQGNCGYHRQYQPYYNHNTGSRGGYRGGGYNPRYAGGRPPRAVEDPTANAIAETPQVAQATASRAPMFKPVVQPQAQGNADSSLVIQAAEVTTKANKKKEIMCFRCELTGHVLSLFYVSIVKRQLTKLWIVLFLLFPSLLQSLMAYAVMS